MVLICLWLGANTAVCLKKKEKREKAVLAIRYLLLTTLVSPVFLTAALLNADDSEVLTLLLLLC